MPVRFLGYDVYEDGRVWRLPRQELRVIRGVNFVVNRAGGWVKTRVRNADKGTGGGYVFIDLYMEGKKKTYLLHRLVAMCFIPTDNFNLDVNHKNGIRDDNRVENLEWLSRSSNQKHAYRSGVRTDIGERHCNAKMLDSVVAKLHTLRAQGKSLQELATLAGVNFRSISRALKGGHSVTRGMPPTPDQRYSGASPKDVFCDVQSGMSRVDVMRKYGLSRTTVWKMCKKEMTHA